MKAMSIIIHEDDKPDVLWMDHTEVSEATIEYYNPWQEIRSNPAMAAALAGASPETWVNLPGEQVAHLHTGTEVTITYQMTFRLPNPAITKFKPALP